MWSLRSSITQQISLSFTPELLLASRSLPFSVNELPLSINRHSAGALDGWRRKASGVVQPDLPTGRALTNLAKGL